MYKRQVEGCKPKDMIGIPWMLAFALRDTGWYQMCIRDRSYEEMELDTIGDRKTALFGIISDTDDTFNFVVAIMYWSYE